MVSNVLYVAPWIRYNEHADPARLLRMMICRQWLLFRELRTTCAAEPIRPMPRPAQTFARFVVTPENRAAWLALHDLASGSLSPHLLCLHGPPGCGKSHLVNALAAEIGQQRPAQVVTLLTAVHL